VHDPRGTSDAPDAATRREHRNARPKRAASIRAKSVEKRCGRARNQKPHGPTAAADCVGASMLRSIMGEGGVWRAGEGPQRDSRKAWQPRQTRSVASER